MNQGTDAEQLGNSGWTSETPVFAWLDGRDVECARRWSPAFSVWGNYENFVAERDARFVGFGCAGVTARFFPVTFLNFEHWLRLTGAPADIEAIDAFAAHCAFRADHPDAPVIGRLAASERRADDAIVVSGAQCVPVRPEIFARWRNSQPTTEGVASPDLDAYATQVIAHCVSPDGRNLRPLVRSA